MMKTEYNKGVALGITYAVEQALKDKDKDLELLEERYESTKKELFDALRKINSLENRINSLESESDQD